MAEDAPDWYTLDRKVEVTNRLNQMFPTGKAIISDDFSEPILSWQEIGDAGGSVALTTTYSMTPPNSVKITTVGTDAKYKAIGNTVGLPESQKMGLEMAWSKPTVADSYTFFGINSTQNTVISQAQARYSHTLGKWQVLTLSAGWIDVTDSTQDLRDDSNNFHRCKLTMDFDSGYYIELLSDEGRFDIREADIRTGATAARNTAQAFCGALNFSAAPRTIYIDNATVTEE